MHVFGIPHPPGTPLYVSIGRTWSLALSPFAGTARAMNLFSAASTAIAGALTTSLVMREVRPGGADAAWGAVACGLVAGLMYSAWANATETEVYAISLLHVVLMLASASRADESPRGARWLLLTAYLIALAPAVHLSALVGAPAAIALAARRSSGGWMPDRALVMSGVLVATAGVGRVSPVLVACGVTVLLAGLLVGDERRIAAGLPVAALLCLAASALSIMLVRSRVDPLINQGNPATLRALADVVARRQYAVAPLLPRQAPAWLQVANIAQYADWQVAMGWGRGIFTTPLRVVATIVYVALGVVGWRAMRRDAERLAIALLVLVACGTVGVATYLNFKAGASLGGGPLAGLAPQEARERDYFFVLGFWGWGCMAAWGGLAVARRVERPPLALVAAIVPLIANWGVVDRSREPEAGAARRFAMALLRDAPAHAVLFTAGDNDSYPLWYLQAAEGIRPDVQVITVPLLPTEWYEREIARRTGLKWQTIQPPVHARFEHERTAARIAASALASGRPVGASAALTAHERALLGDDWTLRGAVYWSATRASGRLEMPRVDSSAARQWIAMPEPSTGPGRGVPDDVASIMLGLLECPRLGLAWQGTTRARDSLEVRCNVR